MKRWLAILLGVVLAIASRAAESPLILISLDGFRWDYTELFPAESPTLRALKRDGSSASALVPVFPSNTFPNHYTIVTGLYPANHGIINNDFFDATTGAVFHFNQPALAHDPRWWRGEPIWTTSVKQGRKAGSSFWVGSDVEIGGARPTYWRRFDSNVRFEDRLEELIDWMHRPPGERPAVVALYIEEVNGAGHRYGPRSAEVAAAIKLCDDRIAQLLARLRAINVEPNLLIVSDHGMAATSVERIIKLEDYVERSAIQIDAEGSVVAMRPLKGDAASLVHTFRDVPHARAYLAGDLPPHFHLPPGDRVSPVWVLPDEGWHAVTQATFERLRRNFNVNGYLQGDHGYDPASPNMHGILIAHGPAFRRGRQIPPVENIHLYPLLCAVLQLVPAKSDGDDRLVQALLATPGSAAAENL
jgi:predicted AlkP superfamily pyrophosphatase or phosphodiesterase